MFTILALVILSVSAKMIISIIVIITLTICRDIKFSYHPSLPMIKIDLFMPEVVKEALPLALKQVITNGEQSFVVHVLTNCRAVATVYFQ